MTDSLFVLSGKDLAKLSMIMLLAVLLFGLTGLIIMFLFQWMTLRSYAADAVDKHGISQVKASRLGGAAIFTSWLGLMIIAHYNGYMEDNLGGISGPYAVCWLTVGCCATLGFFEDMYNNILSPRLRLVAELLIFGTAIGFWSILIPSDLGFPGLDVLMSLPIIGWLITVIFCVGFINSVNMADGANGLVSGTMTVAFSLFYFSTGESAYAAMMTVCALFTIINVISGRLFLGDMGACGLGAFSVISALYLFSQDVFSAAFLAVLFSYPCIDLLMTLGRRRLNKSSILLPDNDHLHNRVHFYFQRWLRSKTLANSMTGVLIVICSSGLALLGYIQEWWPLASNQWVWVFFVQCVLYLLVFVASGRSQLSSQHVASP